MKLCTVVWNPKSKIEFVGSQNPTTHSPSFPQPKFSPYYCRRITEKAVNGFWRNSLSVGHGPGTKWLNFGDDPDHRPDPGVRSPKSGFTGLSKKLPTDFDEILRLETNWLHFGDDPHHYPDPGFRSGSRSGSGKYWCSAEVCAVWVLLVSICNNCSHCSDWRPDGDCARWVLFLFLESWCQRFEIELKSINAGNFIKFCTVFADYRHSIWTRQLKRTYVLRSEEVVLKSFLLPSVLSWRKSAQTPYISVSAGRNKHSQREA